LTIAARATTTSGGTAEGIAACRGASGAASPARGVATISAVATHRDHARRVVAHDECGTRDVAYARTDGYVVLTVPSGATDSDATCATGAGGSVTAIGGATRGRAAGAIATSVATAGSG
jgi:hypothetical protein